METASALTATVTYEEDTERARLALSAAAAPGDWTLSIGFDGILNDKLRGFYRSTFTDHEGVERTLATTQFEATDARRAFPCWDEPEFKAVFGITLVVEPDLLAISNARRGRPPGIRRRQSGRSLRRHDEDVDLPGCLCGRRLWRRPNPSTSTVSPCASCTHPARPT